MRASITLPSLIAAVGFAAGACWPASAQEADWDKVIAAAKKEGTVTVYHASLGAPHFAAIVKTFEDKYGIEVKQFDARASELSERIRTEQASGRYVADLEYHGAATVKVQAKDGYIQPRGFIPNAANIREPFEVTPISVPGWMQPTAMLINTEMVKPEDEPKNWTDMLDPKWKGKILSDDPRALGSGQTMFYVTYKKYGREFQEKLIAQDLVFSRDLQVNARRVARGEYPVLLEQIIPFAKALQGLPVKVIVPSDGVFYTVHTGAILKGAPHYNAARLFMNHVIELESQKTYGESWMGTVIKDVAEHLSDPDAKRFATAKLLGTTSPEDQQAMLDLAKQMYK